MSQAQPTDDADLRATEFQAATSEPPEQFSGSTLLVEAYAAIWLILMGWLLLLWRKQAALSTRLSGLEAALDRAASAADRGGAEKAG